MSGQTSLSAPLLTSLWQRRGGDGHASESSPQPWHLRPCQGEETAQKSHLGEKAEAEF